MSDDRRHRRFYEKRQFERAIAREVRAEREQKEDRALLCKRHVGSLMTRKWI